MYIKDAKEFTTNEIYDMVILLNIQTEEIEHLKDKLERCKREDLTELYSPEYSTEDVPFDGESDFYEE